MQTLKIIDHITLWLKNYAENSKMAGFVVGVSGGIDSAVTSCLCARTGCRVLVLNMPIHQPPDQVSRSSAHIEWLGKKHDNVQGIDMDLTPAFEQLKASLPEQVQDGLTMANTRSRLRMLTLYAFASHHRMLVAGTGNRVEDFGVGFYTKYGDGGVDLSPIANLMKSEVYALGKELGVSTDILNARPTDGLWDDDRTDESQIGATYAELEWAMAHLDQALGEKEAAEKTLSLRQKEVLEIFSKFHEANRHKMDPIPVCMIPEELKQ